MEQEQTVSSQVEPVSPTPQVPKIKNSLVLIMSILLIVTVGIASLFYFQIQKLSKELSKYQTQPSPTPLVSPASPSQGGPEPSAEEDKFTAPTAWAKFTTQDGLKLCLPPKWESNQYGTLIYNRDTSYQPGITIIQSIPYTSGSYADAYYNFWKQEYPNASQLVTATQTNINGNTTFKFTPKGEAKSSPEGLAIVWFASGKLWKAGLSSWSMINSSQTNFLKDFYTMISCSF